MDETRMRLGEDLSDSRKCLPPGRRNCPDILVTHTRGQASPFLDVLLKEKQESMVCSFEYVKYAVMPDSEKPR